MKISQAFSNQKKILFFQARLSKQAVIYSFLVFPYSSGLLWSFGIFYISYCKWSVDCGEHRSDPSVGLNQPARWVQMYSPWIFMLFCLRLTAVFNHRVWKPMLNVPLRWQAFVNVLQPLWKSGCSVGSYGVPDQIVAAHLFWTLRQCSSERITALGRANSAVPFSFIQSQRVSGQEIVLARSLTHSILNLSWQGRDLPPCLMS